ncbi:plasma kallikrein [Trichonephila clavata]|uniref:Plasma kallikrein n=1 Tax=Trichonephila clavata TaxID=2740835 RepID=A0A8X6LHW8_TRICU|nr:plasma kallikrein [Trichonephila clavata]
MNRASSSQNCVCGGENEKETERFVDSLIVNPPHKYPWVVGLVRKIYYSDDFYCGGALISRHYVLTAAYCLVNQTIHNTRVALGAHDFLYSPEPVQISLMLAHPQYRVDSSLYNIGLLKLQAPAQLGPNVDVLCLPNSSDIGHPDQMATEVGWDVHRYPMGGKYKELQEVDLRILSFDQCSASKLPNFDKTQICAERQRKSFCKGDSGGPLIIKKKNKWYGVGIAAWSSFCGVLPSVFTKVTEYLPWIEKETRDSPPCNIEPWREGDNQPPVKPNLDNCGIPNEMESGRIAGGRETTPFEFPWMAIIEYNDLFLGSGALVSPKFVLTAASIFQDWMLKDLHKITVLLGKHKISALSEQHEKRFNVKVVHIHIRYNIPTIHNNDLALIHLKKAADSQYRPICLPQRKDEYFPNTVLTIAGWGDNHERSPLSHFLQKADMKILLFDVCKDKYPEWFNKRMICVQNEEVDACKGDGGAPLMRQYEGRYYLAGVASWNSTQGCRVKGQPRVFSAVRSSLIWISNRAKLDVV